MQLLLTAASEFIEYPRRFYPLLPAPRVRANNEEEEGRPAQDLKLKVLVVNNILTIHTLIQSKKVLTDVYKR